MIREKANTVPRVNCGGGSGAALMEEVGVLISMNKDPGMKGKATPPLWLLGLGDICVCVYVCVCAWWC